MQRHKITEIGIIAVTDLCGFNNLDRHLSESIQAGDGYPTPTQFRCKAEKGFRMPQGRAARGSRRLLLFFAPEGIQVLKLHGAR
jgi:hypothetical protein